MTIEFSGSLPTQREKQPSSAHQRCRLPRRHLRVSSVYSLCLLSVLAMTSGCQRFESAPIDSEKLAVVAEPLRAQLPVLTARDLASYVDPVAGFSGRIPVGWTQVILSKPEERGYAISFESPASNSDDVFADYLMVEFLEGSAPEGFLADPVDRREIEIDGRTAHREKILLDDFEVGGDQIDLVVFQLTRLEIGYSVGLYAVGEQRELARLEQVFEAFVKSFEFPPVSMQVTQL